HEVRFPLLASGFTAGHPEDLSNEEYRVPFWKRLRLSYSGRFRYIESDHYCTIEVEHGTQENIDRKSRRNCQTDSSHLPYARPGGGGRPFRSGSGSALRPGSG